MPRARDWPIARRFIACDYATGLTGPFDLIVSNPPYIRSADIGGLAVEVRDYDPLAALDGGADGLDAYRALIPQAACLLAPGAVLVVEAGQGQSGDIEALMTAAGLTHERPPKADLAGIPGRSRAENCPHKARLRCKKTTWNIRPGATTFRTQRRSRVCWPRRCP